MGEVSLKLRRHCIEENSYYSVSSMYGFFIYMHFRFCHWWHSNFGRKCHWHSSGWQLIGNESHFIFWTSLPVCYSCKRRNIKNSYSPIERRAFSLVFIFLSFIIFSLIFSPLYILFLFYHNLLKKHCW